jgi:tetratricopeptide (TPR) repeat protein
MTSASGDVWIKRDVLAGISSVYADQAEYEKALHYIQMACKEKKHDGLHVIHELNYLCILWLDIGAEKKVLQTFEKIETAFSTKKTRFIRPTEIFDDTNRFLRTGFKYFLKKNYAAAARSLYKALPRVKKSRRFESLIHTYMFIIKTEFARKDYQKAQKVTREFLSYAKRTRCRKYIAQGHLFSAHVFFVKKRYAQARRAAAQCRSLCKRYNLRGLHWQAHYVLGKIGIRQKQYRTAWKDLTTAQEIINTITTELSNSLKRIYLAKMEIMDLKKEISVLKGKDING